MEKLIDKHLPTPIYSQISDWMRKKILLGKWEEDGQIPSEADLSKKFNVSRGTIRKAIEDLISEQLLVRIHGKGTYVKTNIFLKQSPRGRLAGFSRDLISKGIPYETTVLTSEIIPPPAKVTPKLNLEENEKIYHLQRLRIVHEKPIILIENHIDYQRCQGIEDYNFEIHQLYTTLENDFQIEFSWAHRSYYAQAANRHISETLNIPLGDPIFYLEELYHVTGDIPVEFTRAWIRANVFHISTIVQREDEKSEKPELHR